MHAIHVEPSTQMCLISKHTAALSLHANGEYQHNAMEIMKTTCSVGGGYRATGQRLQLEQKGSEPITDKVRMQT